MVCSQCCHTWCSGSLLLSLEWWLIFSFHVKFLLLPGLANLWPALVRTYATIFVVVVKLVIYLETFKGFFVLCVFRFAYVKRICTNENFCNFVFVWLFVKPFLYYKNLYKFLFDSLFLFVCYLLCIKI